MINMANIKPCHTLDIDNAKEIYLYIDLWFEFRGMRPDM
jgi:hypothetical protein